MIQLVCKSEDGHTELAMMRYLNQPELRIHPHNRLLPVLEELHHRDMIFLVMPLLHDGLITPWFYNFGEALDAMQQTFAVSKHAA